jgi:uncharacterized protein YyaL (SSP411 family)
MLMRLQLLRLFWIGFLAGLVSTPASSAGLTNQLKNHSSPYLALHGEDPVAWQDWTPGAIAAARRENKLLFVSIGYFSCHWCHVMQRESYRNPDTARYLNQHFVAVKVDRELEPALDARLIAFAEKTQGVGGWPLNVFLTPEGHPLYAVLYLPPAEFRQVLTKLQTLWQEDPDSLKRVAREAAGGGKGPGEPRLAQKRVQRYVDKVLANSHANADPFNGGFGEESKFPSVPQLQFLLTQYRRNADPELKALLVRTLDNMKRYGLYDHIGGGFFRYTVDPGWRTPHFEKMLYDNAQLASLYLTAARLWQRQDYEHVARETLAFMTETMRRPEGGLIASLSAIDGNNIEGGYYLWHPKELQKVLTHEELKIYLPLRGMTDAPAFDDGHLPMASKTVAEVASLTGLPESRVAVLLSSADKKLRVVRAKRTLPVDSKLLAGWNGLALSAYVDAARMWPDSGYRALAAGVRDYIMETLWDGKRLRRSIVAGIEVGQSSLEDYAQVAKGLLDYAILTGNKQDMQNVQKIMQTAWERFYREDGWRLSASSLIQSEVGQDAIADGPMPSPSGSLMHTTLILARLTGDEALERRAVASLNSGHQTIAADPFWYVGHIGAMRTAVEPPNKASAR